MYSWGAVLGSLNAGYITSALVLALLLIIRPAYYTALRRQQKIKSQKTEQPEMKKT